MPSNVAKSFARNCRVVVTRESPDCWPTNPDHDMCYEYELEAWRGKRQHHLGVTDDPQFTRSLLPTPDLHAE
jgi:hypothetical protein